ncbi:MAG: ATP-binding protein [Pseudobdellovibrionaceae bacterium]
MAQLLKGVLDHQDIIQRFLNSYKEGRLPHTFLFVGPAGVGRKTVAIALAQNLLCEKSVPACGLCGSCLRVSNWASALNSKKNSATGHATGTESLWLIQPEKNQIRLDQAHQILDFLSLRTLSKNRVVIIDGAETLNPQAANSLLKSLEEPPVGTYFFLIAPSAAHVLSTLKSRAQVVAFSPLQPSDMKKKVSAPEWALRASQGSFERLSQLLEKDELEIRQSALAWLQDWASGEGQGYLKSENRELVRDRSVARSLAHHVSWLLRDAMYLKLGASEKVLNSDQIPVLEKLNQSLSVDHLLRACEKSLWIEQKLDQNQDSSLVFEQFWIETRP